MQKKIPVVLVVSSVIAASGIVSACRARPVQVETVVVQGEKNSAESNLLLQDKKRLRTHWVAYREAKSKVLKLMNYRGDTPKKYEPIEVESYALSHRLIAHVSAGDHYLRLLDGRTGKPIDAFKPIADWVPAQARITPITDYQVSDRFLAYKIGGSYFVWDVESEKYLPLSNPDQNDDLNYPVTLKISNSWIVQNDANGVIRLLNALGSKIEFVDQDGNKIDPIRTHDFLLSDQFLVARALTGEIHLYELDSDSTAPVARDRTHALYALSKPIEHEAVASNFWLSDDVFAFRNESRHLVVVPARNQLKFSYTMASEFESAKVAGSRILWQEKVAQDPQKGEVYFWDTRSSKIDPKQISDQTLNLENDVLISEFLIAYQVTDAKDHMKTLTTVLGVDLSPLASYKALRLGDLQFPFAKR